MSLLSVKNFFKQHNLDNRIVTLPRATATVEEAAREHKVTAGEICKTLSFKLDEKPILILVAGDKKIDNKKYKAFFGKKAKMLTPDEAVQFTGHEIGGVCPFGLPEPIDVYMDESLREYQEVWSAAGDKFSAIKLTVQELEKYSNCKDWIDICK